MIHRFPSHSYKLTARSARQAYLTISRMMDNLLDTIIIPLVTEGLWAPPKGVFVFNHGCCKEHEQPHYTDGFWCFTQREIENFAAWGRWIVKGNGGEFGAPDEALPELKHDWQRRSVWLYYEIEQYASQVKTAPEVTAIVAEMKIDMKGRLN